MFPLCNRPDDGIVHVSIAQKRVERKSPVVAEATCWCKDMAGDVRPQIGLGVEQCQVARFIAVTYDPLSTSLKRVFSKV